MTVARSILPEGIDPRDWMLCFVGDKQTDLLEELSTDLSGEFSSGGDKKVIRSGFSYWGLGPTIGWVRTTTDPTYPNAYQATISFRERWRSPRMRSALLKSGSEYVYVSLGIGTGDKDISVLEDLVESSNKKVIVLAVDISVEMLKIAVSRILDRFPSQLDIMAVQVDLAKKESLDRLREIAFAFAKDHPILFSLLGNTIANFAQDDLRLRAFTEMMRPQDRMLIEVGTTQRDTEEASKAAAREYQISPRFKNFVSESLVANTGMSVELDNIKVKYEREFIPGSKNVKAIYLKILYISDNDTAFRLAGMDEKHSIEFRKGDSIRIYVTRKYTEDGFASLLKTVRCSNLAHEYKPFRETSATPVPYFGMSLYLIGPPGASEIFDPPQTIPG